MAHRHDGRNLSRLKNPVVVVALDRGESPDHFRIAGTKADSPASHAVTFAHRGELDTNVFCSRSRQKTRSLVSIKADVRVGEIADHHEIVLFRQRDQFSVKRLLNAGRRRVVRVVDDDKFRTRKEVLAGVGNPLQKLLRVAAVQGDDVAGSQHDGVNVDRKTGRRHDRRIARPHQSQAKVAEAFL